MDPPKFGVNTRLRHIQNWSELAKQAKWSVAQLARLCGVSARTLERHFLKELGKRPKKWLAEQRRLRAIELLKAGDSVKETAGNLGYRHAGHFSREFKEY